MMGGTVGKIEQLSGPEDAHAAALVAHHTANAPAREKDKDPDRAGPPTPRIVTAAVTPASRDAALKTKDERVPLWLNVPVGLAHMAWAMWDGFKKYGIASWRKPEVPVTALSMIGAAERHLQLLKDGQDYAPDSRAHHAGHVMACMQIYLDCEAIGKAGFDNRVPGPAAAVWPCQQKVA